MAVLPRFNSLALAVLFTAHGALGAEVVKAELLPLTLFPRSGAPALFDLRLTPQRPGLLEGRVAITLNRNGSEALHWTTHEIALAGGVQTLRLLSPPLPAWRYGGSFDAKLEFISLRGVIPLGTVPFAADPGRFDRRAVIAVCTPGERSRRVEGVNATWQRLRLEDVLRRTASVADESVATTPVFLEPEDFPTEPLAYCAFDLMLIEERMLERLLPRALIALVRWWEGGGTVAILSLAETPDDRRAALDRWLAEGKGGKAMAASPSTAADGSLLAYAGLGRGAVLAASKPGVVGENKKDGAAEFLWSRVEEQSRGPSRTSRTAAARSQWRNDAAFDQSRTFQVLMPTEVRLLPPWQVFGLLALLVALVGPIDWLVLGRLRARRYTWLLFPVAVAATTAATVALAELALGWATHRASATVKDLGPDGRVLRTHRFELTLVPRETTVRDQLTGAIAVPLALRPTATGLATASTLAPPRIRGQFPARYELERPLRQWSPSIVRTLSFGGEDDSGLAWDDLRLRDPAAWSPRSRGRGAGLRKPPRGWEIALMQGRSSVTPWPLETFSAPCLWRTHGPTLDGAPGTTVAPSGDALCDDFAISDSADARQWFVIAARRVGRDVHVYRRLFFQ